MTRPFRFGVVTPIYTDLPTWLDRARRIADSGYSTLLMPDFPLSQPAPAPVLATAAAVTDLRVGTWVYASPLRPSWLTAWEAHSLSLMTGGRFEMGIGTGRPGIEDELRDKGMPAVPPPGDRLASIRETLTALREFDGPDQHTPVAMAVYGPKARALAAEFADTVTFPLFDQPRAEIARLTQDFRTTGNTELALAIPIIGDYVAPHMAPPGTDPAPFHAANAVNALPDDPSAAAEEIQRRREELGFSYFIFGADYAERFAPIVAKLAGT
ncbi:LLM class flavin-dependent oxidoreductase [Nocardia sp. NBC_01503]|uniref:LLM class flavin-dependent oxidoreductase n=1 Tax=Nocardia sp. NBC_01503 TaxID=2975997 RepID=UPI002E7B7C18|nr:LLM class flavin-dependent oxidoreductase [Nocardia sp. NBC_01503]WTL30497.1 LLM class flavin-dependent oxidoreductase [Nocardia sp. NBC_01503]